jgi:hypothetical protein
MSLKTDRNSPPNEPNPTDSRSISASSLFDAVFVLDPLGGGRRPSPNIGRRGRFLSRLDLLFPNLMAVPPYLIKVFLFGFVNLLLPAKQDVRSANPAY